MDILELIKAVILGLVEGMTEFAPVSSTGHMIIVDDMWLKSEAFLTGHVANTFKIVIQLGSVLAVVVVFRERFYDLLGLKKSDTKRERGGRRLKLPHIFVGLLPAAVIGLAFEDVIDTHLFSTKTVLIGLLLGAILMMIADKYAFNKPTAETVDQITYRQAFSVGLMRCFSFLLGFSRSGASISAGVLSVIRHRTAADFSFIMVVPILAVASVLSFFKHILYFTMVALPFFIVGFISAFVFALLSITFFLKAIDRVKLFPFVVYRVILVVVIWTVYF